VATDELKNVKLSGGLQLPCLATMGRALLTSQCLRLLMSNDRRYVRHIEYWMGALINNFCPNIVHGIQSSADSPYFNFLGDCFASILTSGFLSSTNFRSMTNKQLYLHLGTFPVPKVVREAPPDARYKLAWKRLYNSYLSSDEKQVVFLLIHNKLPLPERLFRIGLRRDPYCLFCSAAIECDIEHFFCLCVKTKSAWNWLRSSLMILSHGAFRWSNFDLLNLLLPQGLFDQEVSWLIGIYVHYVWLTVYSNKRDVKVEKLFGFLKFKFKIERKLKSVKLESLLK